MYQNPDPQKWHERTKSQKELSKQIEEIIRHYAMPRGVKTQKISGISQQLFGLKNRMEEQLFKLNEEQMDRMRVYLQNSNKAQYSQG